LRPPLRPHAVGHHREHAARHARVAEQRDLILLVGPVALVQASGGGKSEASGHERGDRGREACGCVDEALIIIRSFPPARVLGPRALDSNLHSVTRRLIELRMEHADLDASIDRLAETAPADELLLRRLKKRRLALRDEIARLELLADPQEPA
jgi:hypothetical protein